MNVRSPFRTARLSYDKTLSVIMTERKRHGDTGTRRPRRKKKIEEFISFNLKVFLHRRVSASPCLRVASLSLLFTLGIEILMRGVIACGLS